MNTSIIDLGDRLRMTACEVEVVTPPEDLPHLPVARSLWRAKPDLTTAAKAWILAGGSHHSSHSTSVRMTHIEDYARIIGVELIVIDNETTIPTLERELRWNDVAHLIGRR